MNQRLQAKDLINVGMFTALYFVCFFATGMLGYIPIFLVLLPLFCPLVAGIPFVLYLTKVKKFGMVTITGTILGILMFITGHPWPVLVSGSAFGFLGDLVMKAGNYLSWKNLLIGYVVFSEWILGALAPFFFMRETYFAAIRAGYGDTYTDTLMKLTPMWVFYCMILLAIAGGTAGAYLGKAVLKKHFKKAGIA
ncbi:MptD family putative ECF transporter S component [Clostridium boliviensis]|uniref:MptD family putative ECF transporter S component n=1 Tax=Clostridium boliviensis TaxID=318465 RepID=A0ABU4GT85_9CLOT|nr:MptD family putative ECF transporter S component [Clostridium boliviensis]MDW2800852.1 MptD family putative ECF transporter S component [Clostridium boliviensis]